MLDQKVNEAIRVLWMSTEYDRSNDIKKMPEEAAAEKDGDACLLLSRCYCGACFIPEKFNFEEDDVKCEEYLDMSIRSLNRTSISFETKKHHSTCKQLNDVFFYIFIFRVCAIRSSLQVSLPGPLQYKHQ